MDGNSTSTGGYAAEFLHKVVNGLPAFLGALLTLAVGYIIARVVAGVALTFLQKARLNEHLHTGKGGNVIQRAVPNPAQLVAALTFWLILLFALSLAISVLGIPALVDLVRAVYFYMPNVLAALLIFIIAGAVSAGVTTLVTNTMGGTFTGRVAAASAPIVVMGIAVFMILDQLKIAPAIVTITYAALMGSASLGLALAFGLGGREVAGTILQDLYEKERQNKGTAARDFQKSTRTAR